MLLFCNNAGVSHRNWLALACRRQLRQHKRGRALMRDRLFARVGASGKNAFPFIGARCDRVVLGVFARLRELHSEA